MEFRAWIELPRFPHVPDERWMGLLDWLDVNTDMGPVLSGPVENRPGVSVVLATDAADEAGAVRAMVDVTTRALQAIGLGDQYPALIELGRVEVVPA